MKRLSCLRILRRVIVRVNRVFLRNVDNSPADQVSVHWDRADPETPSGLSAGDARSDDRQRDRSPRQDGSDRRETPWRAKLGRDVDLCRERYLIVVEQFYCVARSTITSRSLCLKAFTDFTWCTVTEHCEEHFFLSEKLYKTCFFLSAFTRDCWHSKLTHEPISIWSLKSPYHIVSACVNRIKYAFEEFRSQLRSAFSCQQFSYSQKNLMPGHHNLHHLCNQNT